MTHPRYGSMEPKDLHVLTMISNPVRYTSRYRLWEEFNARMIRDGVTLWTAELQLGARPFVITKKGNPRHIQARGRDELWAKENTLNRLAIALPHHLRAVGAQHVGGRLLQDLDLLRAQQALDRDVALGPVLLDCLPIDERCHDGSPLGS